MTVENRAETAVLGGRTARACENCLGKRARWFCAADDAFLCHECDSSVHSANQLASRHERIRLDSVSSKPIVLSSILINNSTSSSSPSWLRGFTRKARTPRNNHNSNNNYKLSFGKGLEEKRYSYPVLPLVPEIESEDTLFDENEDHLLHRVPVFDPFAEEFHDVLNEEDDLAKGFLPSEIDLADFVADVENLLEEGNEKESREFKEIGLFDYGGEEEDERGIGFEDDFVKIKDEEVEALKNHYFLELERESLDFNYDGEEAMEEKKTAAMTAETADVNREKSISLRLNYEAVITAWDNESSPWTTGNKPDFNLDDCWPHCLGMLGDVQHTCGIRGGGAGRPGGGRDEEREARVLRYREKRRTRLFSKKIRYEVRKLNAEKRPRMKGRFVKRTSFSGPSCFPNYSIN